MPKSYQSSAVLALGAVVMLVVMLAGCDSNLSEQKVAQPAAADGAEKRRVGVIDIGQIYQAMGYQQERISRVRALQQKQADLLMKFEAAYKTKIEEFGGDVKNLNDEQKIELNTLKATAMQARQKSATNADQAVREMDQFLANRVAQETRQPIKNIAKAEGLDVVLVKQPNNFAYINPDIDITDKVLEQLDLPNTLPATTPISPDLMPGDKPITPPLSQEPPTEPAAKPELDEPKTTSENAPEGK